MLKYFKQSIKGKTNIFYTSSKSTLSLCLLLFVILSLSYSAVIPIFEGFDETAYYSYITYLHTQRHLPQLDHETAAYSYELIAQPPFYPLLGAIATAPFSMENVHHFAWNSRNVYHGGLSKRQSVTLPGHSWAETMPVYVARLISMLGGLITLWASWLLALSATVTNDAWAAGTVALSVATATYFWFHPVTQPARVWFIVGICVGCAILTKYSGFLLALPMSILFIANIRQRSIAQMVHAIVYVTMGAALIAGGWYLRNLWQWGELIPMTQMSEILPTLLRPEPYSLAKTLSHIPWLLASYWGVFVSIIGPAWYLESAQWFMAIGSAGLLIYLMGFMKRSKHPGDNADLKGMPILAMAAVWCSGAALSVLYWTRTIDYGEQGRLLHIAGPAFALLWVMGWQAFIPRKWHGSLHWAIMLFMVGLGISQLFMLQSAYQLPESVVTTRFDRPIQAQFAGGMQLRGIDLPNGAALMPDEPLPLILYFSTDQIIEQDYTLFLHLADSEEALLFQFDGVPVQGNHVTRQWLPNQIFADRYDLKIAKPGVGELADLSLGFYKYEEPSKRQPIIDAHGTSVDDRVVLGKIRLLSQDYSTSQIAMNSIAIWQPGIQLLNADIEQDAQDRPGKIQLSWQARTHLHEDYPLFIQILDRNRQLIAQIDRPPLPPTSTWLRGDVVKDSYDFTEHFTIGDSANWDQVIVGWYRLDGQRLYLQDGEESEDKSYWVLQQRTDY